MCRRQCIIGRQLSDGKRSVCRHVTKCSGCDSIVSTTLIVDTAVYSTTDLELCYGDSALFGGVMYDTSGVYVDTLQSVAGCDSIATLNLTIKDLNVGDTTILVACDSAEWNGVTYDTSGYM